MIQGQGLKNLLVGHNEQPPMFSFFYKTQEMIIIFFVYIFLNISLQ